MPKFVPRGAPVLPSLLALSAAMVLVDTTWYVFLAWLVSLARRVLTRPAVRQRVEQVSGLVMVGFGVRLAVERLQARSPCRTVTSIRGGATSAQRIVAAGRPGIHRCACDRSASADARSTIQIRRLAGGVLRRGP